mmetsp:Transcript_1777/g.5660  ORF Transcript_1777/g.5660 Transcript_1777/m.5660 type:complete len:310 (-) Transcript_1777:3528-4457(-)
MRAGLQKYMAVVQANELGRFKLNRRLVLSRCSLQPDTKIKFESLLGASLETVDIFPVNSGFCNSVYKVESNTGAKIIKLYSETSKLRTESQLRGVADCLLAQVQMSPGVSALSPEGIVHDYIEGAALSESDLCTNLDLAFTVATVLRRLHKLPIPKEYGNEPLIWGWLESMLNCMKMRKPLLPHGITVAKIERELYFLRGKVEAENFDVAFCHGDCKPSNLLVDLESRLWLIDLELAGPNYRGLDLIKLFRTQSNRFSEGDLKMFLSNYCAKDEFLAVKLEHECRICEILSWLEVVHVFKMLGDNNFSK